MQTLQQPDIDRRHAHRKLRWQPNFTQGLSCLKNSLVRLLLNPHPRIALGTAGADGQCPGRPPPRPLPCAQTATMRNQGLRGV
jgi:hypothetical protein